MQKKMVPKHELLENIPLHVQELNCKKGVYELKDHIGEKALGLNLPPKLGSAKKTLLASFFSCLLKAFESNPHSPMPCCPTTRGQNKIPLE
jgi:hypothetical protein